MSSKQTKKNKAKASKPTVTQIRADIKAFIRENMCYYDVERANGLDSFGVDSLEELFEFNDAHVDKLSLRDLKRVNVIMKMLQADEIETMDKESMVSFGASGFVYNANGRLIIFNER